jgi:hypothetical protein
MADRVLPSGSCPKLNPPGGISQSFQQNIESAIQHIVFRVTIALRLLQNFCKKPEASTLVLNGSLCKQTNYYLIIQGIYNNSYSLGVQLRGGDK